MGSLKAFHLLFVAIAIILSFGFAVWCFAFSPQRAASTVFMGVISLLIGVALIIYRRWISSHYNNSVAGGDVQ